MLRSVLDEFVRAYGPVVVMMAECRRQLDHQYGNAAPNQPIRSAKNAHVVQLLLNGVDVISSDAIRKHYAAVSRSRCCPIETR